MTNRGSVFVQLIMYFWLHLHIKLLLPVDYKKLNDKFAVDNIKSKLNILNNCFVVAHAASSLPSLVR